MKKLMLIVVVAALALTLVPLALAGGPGGGGWKHGHAKFNLVGKVMAVTPADMTDPEAPVAATITVKVKAGSHIKGMKRTDAMFVVAADVPVWQLTEDGKVESSVDKLAEGDKVMVKGKITKAEDGSKVYTVTSIKYLDRTPDVEPTPEPSDSARGAVRSLSGAGDARAGTTPAGPARDREPGRPRSAPGAVRR